MKKIIWFLLFSCLMLQNSFAYQPLPAEIKYNISQNHKYLLEILPCAEESVEIEKSSHELRRIALTIIIYEKKSVKIAEHSVDYWQEISFFRVTHPDSVKNIISAEAIQGVISNDGNQVAIHSQVNPMARMYPIDDLYIYNRSGNLVQKFSQEQIFKNKTKDILSITIDDKNSILKVISIDKEIRYIDLNTFKIK